MREAKIVSPRARDPAVARWIRRTLAADPPRAGSLIVTVWGDSLAPHGGSVWMSGLIRLMAPFGINERLVRTSVFRLARDGWLARTAHGRESRYRLTADGARRFDEAYRRIYARPGDDWHGQWEIVLVNGIPPARRARLRDELVWSGFGELGNGAFVRPHEPSRPLPAILSDRKATTALAQDYEGQTPIAERTADAWKVAALADEYRHFLARFGAVIERFRGGGDAEQCFVVRTMLIHAYRRVLLRDPLLPAALLPLDWPGAAAYALCRDFYRLTHRRAERHLADTLSRDGAPWPPANAGFYERFGGL